MTAPGLPEGYASHGAGLTHMRDRLGAMGGTLAIESNFGRGTRVMGAVPIRPVELAPPTDSLLRQATDALSDCFAIYRAVTDERGDVVDFAVEHMNDAARRDLGVGGEEPVGQTLGRLQPDYLRSQAFRWLRHIVELEVPGGREVNAYEPLGGERRRLLQSSDIRAAPLGDGRVVVVWRDVTEHARVDEDLRLQSTVLRRVADGVCLVRASDGVIVYANHRFAEIMGYEDGELDGRPVADINWEDEPGQAELIARQISADLERFGEARCELRNRRKDGSLIWCEAHVVGFDHPDHGRVWVSVQRDVTARREARARSSPRQRARPGRQVGALSGTARLHPIRGRRRPGSRRTVERWDSCGIAATRSKASGFRCARSCWRSAMTTGSRTTEASGPTRSTARRFGFGETLRSREQPRATRWRGSRSASSASATRSPIER